MVAIKYKRVLIKISGEALGGDEGFGINVNFATYLAQELLKILELKVEVGIVIGGGNFLRGVNADKIGLDRVIADQIGMLATLINALTLRDVFGQLGITTEVMSALPVGGMATYYNRDVASQSLATGKLVLLAGGTGNPLVSTDSALSLRGIELQADLLLKATNVDGIYSSDPKRDPKATMYKKLTYAEILRKELAVMDLAAFIQCRDYKMNLRIFNLHKPGALKQIILGGQEGTLVSL